MIARQFRRPRPAAAFGRVMLFAMIAMAAASVTSNEAAASAAMAAAAQSADASVSACGSNSGKALYECVANALDQLANNIPDKNVEQTRSALHSAASALRAATRKAQALSAISQCRALISSALAKVRALGGGYVQGWGGGSGAGVGLSAIVNVLSHAAKLIQAKG